MPRDIPDQILATAYGVHRKQIARWRERGLPVEDPAALADGLAQQDRPGRTFDRLARPGGIEQVAAAIRQGARIRSTIS